MGKFSIIMKYNDNFSCDFDIISWLFPRLYNVPYVFNIYLSFYLIHKEDVLMSISKMKRSQRLES